MTNTYYAERTGPNCIAIVSDETLPGLTPSGWEGCYPAIVPVHRHANSAVAMGAVSISQLQYGYELVSEETAQLLHPALFEYLDHGQQWEA